MTLSSGKWEVFVNEDGLGEDKGSITVEADGVVIARVNKNPPGGDGKENARLMAASPEMAEVLNNIQATIARILKEEPLTAIDLQVSPQAERLTRFVNQ